MLLIVHSFLVIFQVYCCNKISSSYHYYGYGEGHQRPNIFLPTGAGCRGSSSSTVCEEVDNYPEEHMKNILENLSDEQRVVFLSNTKKIKGGEVQKMDFHHFGFASNSQETPVCGTQKSKYKWHWYQAFPNSFLIIINCIRASVNKHIHHDLCKFIWNEDLIDLEL